MASFKIGKIVMKSLFKKPATRKAKRVWEAPVRGQILIEEKDCILCSICAKKCPTNAIAVDRKEATWVIERMQCIQCNNCVETCPKKCLIMDPNYTPPSTEKVIDTVQVPKQEKPAPKKEEKAEDKTEAKESKKEKEEKTNETKE